MSRILAFACATWVGACAPSPQPTQPAEGRTLRQAASWPGPTLSLAPPVNGDDFTGSDFGSALAAFPSNGSLYLAVGAPNYRGGAGGVFLFDVSQGPGSPPTLALSLDAPAGGNFGSALAVGYFDSDTFPDLVVGAPTAGVASGGGPGTVYVYSGNFAAGLVEQVPMVLTAGSTGSGVGSTVAVVRDPSRGYVFAGAPGAGETLIFNSDGAGIPLAVSPGGGATAFTFVNADILLDAVVGAPASSTVSVYVAGTPFSLQGSTTGNNDRLGASIAAFGDLNGNQTYDFLVGAPGYPGATFADGQVRFFDGAELHTSQPWSGIGVATTKVGSDFGLALANVGAFGGDDLKFVVGAPNEDGAGAIHLYSLARFPLFIEAWPGGLAGGSHGERLGSALLGAVDLDADGNVDFAVGAPGGNGGLGEVYLFFGTPPRGCATACAECETCVLGACVPLPDDSLCTRNDFCSARNACLSGQCVSTIPTCGFSGCDPNRMQCINQDPWLYDDGARYAVVGHPYEYNPPTNQLRVFGGVSPLTFSTCGSPPPGFDVTGGTVRWTPTMPGDFQICLSVNDKSNSLDSFTYPVHVSAPPQAGFKVMPPKGQAPLHVTVMHDVLEPGLQWSWDFGDMSPLGEGAPATHDYLMPGTYPVDALVTPVGSTLTETARRFVTVLDGAGRQPPLAQIRYVGGVFSCEPCTEGSAPIDTIVWDFENGESVTAPTATRPFGPGSHRVRLTVTDKNRLRGFDAMMVSVPAPGGGEPPKCRLSALPPVGNAPLTVQWSAAVSSAVDAVTAPVTPQTYVEVGPHREELSVHDNSGVNLSCSDFAIATALSELGDPIVFTSTLPKLDLECGDRFTYTPTFTGAPPVTLSLQGPPGATLQMGTLSWVAPQKPGVYPFDLSAQNSAGRTLSPFEIRVSCHGVVPTADGGTPVLDFRSQACGCDAGGASLPALVALAAVVRRRRRGTRSSA